MRKRYITTVVTSAFLAAASPTIADHNSKNGEGTANMPNDIHNTRVETLETNDNEAFRDFVKYGEGSQTVNRFDSDETQPNQANERQGEANAAMSKGESPDRSQDRVETGTRNQDRARVEVRTRLQPGAANRTRPDRSATSARNRGGKKGGRRR